MNGTRTTLALGAAVLLLAGCTTAPPTPVVTATPTPGPTSLLPETDGVVIDEGTAAVSAAAPFDLDIGQGEGVWEVRIACRADEAGSISYLLDQTDPLEGTGPMRLREQPCVTSPDDLEQQLTVLYDGEVPTVLRVTSLIDAELEYRVQPHEG
jgi:hypothetical protein